MTKKIRLVYSFVAVLVLLGVVAFGCAAPAPTEPTPEPAPTEPIVMKFATETTLLGPEGKVGTWLVDEIPKRTNGRVKFEFYPMGQLYAGLDAMQACLSGALEAYYFGYYVEALDPRYKIRALPFLFDDIDHFLRYADGEWGPLWADFETKGMKQMGYWGNCGYYMILEGKKPINKIEDMQGIKLRTGVSPMFTEMCKNLSLSCVNITMAEMLTAIQTKVVDGMITNENTLGQMPTITKMLPYILDVRFYPAPIWFGVSTKWWNTLPADIQQQIEAVLNEGGPMCVELYDKQFEDVWTTVRADPTVTVTTFSDADLAKLREMVRPSWDVVAKEIGPQGWPMIDAAEKYR